MGDETLPPYPVRDLTVREVEPDTPAFIAATQLIGERYSEHSNGHPGFRGV